MWTALRLLLALTALMVGQASAHEIKHKSLSIVHPRVAATSDASASDALVDLTIRNHGKNPDWLVSASSPRAAKVVLESASGDLVVSMEVEPGGELAPRARLLGLTKPLYPYDTFPLTLVFGKGGQVSVEVLVE